jgi:hypothetical protein
VRSDDWPDPQASRRMRSMTNRVAIAKSSRFPEQGSGRPTMTLVSDTIVEDRRATREELRAHRNDLISLAAARGLSNLRLRDDAAIVLSTASPGYRDVARFVSVASQLVGAYVYAVTDDTPGLEVATIPL